MPKIIAIGGMPGTGKTTLMNRIITELTDDWEVAKPAQLLDSIYSEKLNAYILGKYQPYYDGEGYAQGTDRLSMAVQPKAIEFLKETEANIIFEGDRLFTQSFLEECESLGETTIFILKVDSETLQERYDERGSDQSEKFLQGRRTKYNNLMSNFVLMDCIEEVSNKNVDDQQKILKKVLTLLD